MKTYESGCISDGGHISNCIDLGSLLPIRRGGILMLYFTMDWIRILARSKIYHRVN